MKKNFEIGGSVGLKNHSHYIRQEEQKIFSRIFGGGAMVVLAGFSKCGNLTFLDGREKSEGKQL